ncbi:MAG: hypothetical protein M3Y31_02025 [Gemmatimonadota bacterium]|nr:hypothetical protein [Gemmatimonadota bacterium]
MGRKRPVDPDTQYFKYLNRLRSAGRSNMYGAVPYLMRAFGLERLAAFDVVCRWVDAFELRREEAAAVGSTEVVAPLPPKPARLEAPVVVHRPRRASRAKPPPNRKPVPDVRIRIDRKAKPRKVASTDSSPGKKRSRRR